MGKLVIFAIILALLLIIVIGVVIYRKKRKAVRKLLRLKDDDEDEEAEPTDNRTRGEKRLDLKAEKIELKQDAKLQKKADAKPWTVTPEGTMRAGRDKRQARRDYKKGVKIETFTDLKN